MENNLAEQVAWVQFCQASLNFVDAQWLSFTSSPGLMTILAQEPYFKADVARQMKTDFSLEALDASSFNEPLVNQFLLKGPKFVKSVAFLLGAVAYSEVARRSLDGHLKRSFRELLSQQEADFLKKRSAFYHPGFLSEFVPNKLIEESLSAFDLHVVGLWVLTVLLEPLGTPVLRRTNLMFSVNVVALVRECAQTRQVTPEDIHRLDKLVNRLMTEAEGMM